MRTGREIVAFWGLLLVVGMAAGSGRGEEAAAPPVVEQLETYIAAQRASGLLDTSRPDWRQRLPIFPELQYRAGSVYAVRMETERGAVTVHLRASQAPRHVANFLYLSLLGFYDGQPFQFLRPGERVQWGCPLGTGMGTPGYTFEAETTPGVSHDRAGILSMANAGPRTDGSQCFITLQPMPWMDGAHTVFGDVTEGLEVLGEIGEAGTPIGRPRQTIRIVRVTIEELAVNL